MGNTHDFNPMFELRHICQSMESSSNIPKLLIAAAYPNTPSIIQNHILFPALTNNDNPFNNSDISDMVSSMNKLSRFLELNCIPATLPNTHSNESMVVIGASSSGLVSIL